MTERDQKGKIGKNPERRRGGGRDTEKQKHGQRGRAEEKIETF